MGVSWELDLSVDRRARMPLGAQLADRIRAGVENGTLTSGDRLPSVRELADVAGVNVNTARAVYARLESEGLVSSEQGRGTFVAPGGSAGGVATRRELHRQIAELEAALVRLPPRPLAQEAANLLPSPGRAALLSTEDLRGVRDSLLARLRELDAQRAEVMQRLEELGTDELRAGEQAEEEAAPRRSTPSLAGARIRWVGA
jgi:GntR family transcriptional regulator